MVNYELTEEGKEARVEVFRRIEKIYSIKELDNHIQLIVLGYGEGYPTIQLITLEKESLTYIDHVEIYSFVIGENENITRIKGCLNKEFSTLSVKEIQSETAWSTNHDTIEYSYDIHHTGKIEFNY